mmetsp:Transcript_15718/g.37947  ORF Transcript_15718/g.37947 Transcript_15718/m.37947 type:complete len:377 (-) Transcript_15718:109-1239(-)
MLQSTHSGFARFYESFFTLFWQTDSGIMRAKMESEVSLLQHVMFRPEQAGPPVYNLLQAISTLGICASCFMIFSPLSTMFSILRTGRTGKESPVPYFMLWAQAFFWIFYGVLTSHPDIVHINMLTAVMASAYLLILGCHANKEDRHIVQPLIIAGVMTAMGFSAWTLSLGEIYSEVRVFGQVAFVLNIIQGVAPTSLAIEAVRSKSLEGFPVALTAAGFVANTLWAQYAMLVHSTYYLIPNAVGSIFAAAQLAAVAYVHVFYGPDADAEKPIGGRRSMGARRISDVDAAIEGGLLTREDLAEWYAAKAMKVDEKAWLIPKLDGEPMPKYGGLNETEKFTQHFEGAGGVVEYKPCVGADRTVAPPHQDMGTGGTGDS